MSIEAAEALKYACNAFHATKITFANEIGRVLPAVGVDAREVMRDLLRGPQLNISPAYLRPGFAFGGSCLPKDLRALHAHGADRRRRRCRCSTASCAATSRPSAGVVDRVLDTGERARRACSG